MPAKPVWYNHLEGIIENLEALPRPLIDRATLESIMGVGRRRAQQILAPCIVEWVGSSGLADRNALVQHLRTLAAGEECQYELRRRRKVAAVLSQLQRERLEQPRLLVEAPVQIVNQELAELPAGVHLQPGRITIEFAVPQEALEKLLALAMAISNDFERFERQVHQPRPNPQ